MSRGKEIMIGGEEIRGDFVADVESDEEEEEEREHLARSVHAAGGPHRVDRAH